MNNTDLAEFYGVTDRAVRKWSPERKHRKRVQALANAEQPICDLIADISKLVFIFNCKWIRGDNQVEMQCIELDHNHLTVDGTEFLKCVNMHDVDLEAKLKAIKTRLEELVYGVSTIDKRS